MTKEQILDYLSSDASDYWKALIAQIRDRGEMLKSAEYSLAFPGHPIDGRETCCQEEGTGIIMLAVTIGSQRAFIWREPASATWLVRDWLCIGQSAEPKCFISEKDSIEYIANAPILNEEDDFESLREAFLKYKMHK